LLLVSYLHGGGFNPIRSYFPSQRLFGHPEMTGSFTQVPVIPVQMVPEKSTFPIPLGFVIGDMTCELPVLQSIIALDG
jgi:hypothetical protein